MAHTKITSDVIADDAVTTAKIADDAITSALIADDAVVQAAIADDAVDEARIQISNAGSNGQFLSKQSGNTGGLTWATVSSFPDWDTTVKTANFTAVAEKGYLLNTTGGAVTVTLPASATVGDRIAISDAVGKASLNSITLNRNGLNLYGGTDNVTLRKDRASVTLIYADSTNGWVPIGGEDYLSTYTVEVLIVAGGGSGGANKTNGNSAGGGGAGGMQKIDYTVVPANTFSIVIGAGAAQNTAYSTGARGASGSNSSGFGTTSTGGGAGGGSNVDVTGVAGGSGGGGGNNAYSGGSGTSGQGNAGGDAATDSPWRGGGGGGKGAVGGAGETSGNGGAGSNTYATWATATSSGADSGYYAGGGGGGVYYTAAGDTTGGVGGGGKGESANGGDGTSGTANTGGGGGGGGSWTNAGNGGAGGSGIVIVRYVGAQRGSGGTVATTGGYTYHKFTSSGTYTG